MTVPEFTSFWQWLGWFVILVTMVTVWREKP